MEAGAQYISIAGYGYGPTPFRYCPDYFPYPEPDPFMEPFMDEYRGVGLWTAVARRIKDAVDVPVITAGRMDENLQSACSKPAMPTSSRSAARCGPIRGSRARWTRGVSTRSCVARVARAAKIRVTQPRICRVNPTLGQERQLAAKPVAKKKRVMVVGGGPAGMECACTLSERGHEVTLYEKAGALGGRIKLAAMIKSRRMRRGHAYLQPLDRHDREV